MSWLKKIVWILGIGFCLYYLITRPEDAANAVRGFFSAFGAIFRFFATLAG